WDSTLLDFNGESDYVHLIIDDKPDIALSKLIANLKTVSSRLIIAFPVHKRYILNHEKLNQQRLNCTSQIR
ncbi:MAG: transposase, partial [Microcystis sp. M049S1]|nr:transposase [Microcystis sp. M049S1]